MFFLLKLLRISNKYSTLADKLGIQLLFCPTGNNDMYSRELQNKLLELSEHDYRLYRLRKVRR